MRFIKTIFTSQQLKDRNFLIRLVLAFVMMMILVAQLFTYESFHEVMSSGQGNLWPFVITTLVVLLPIYELIALPSLLSMSLSKMVIRLSAYAARIVSLLFVAIILNSMISTSGGLTGLMSTTINMPAHVVTLFVAAIYSGLVWRTTAKQVEPPEEK